MRKPEPWRSKPPLPTVSDGSRYGDSFLEMMAAERGAAINTLDAYSRDLEDFGGFLTCAGLGLHEADT